MSHEDASRPTRMSDEELLAEVKRLASAERETTASLVAHLAELDARRLFLGAGFSSLFGYCTAVLLFSEDATCNRIAAARLVRRFPDLLDWLQDGRLNLTTLRLIGPLLNGERRNELLEAASGKTKREVELLLARWCPKAVVPPSVRKLPEAKPAPDAFLPSPAGPAPHSVPAALPLPTSRRAVVAPLTEDQYRVTFTARAETRQKLKRAQDLLRHQIPDGDLAEIFDRALSLLLEDLARKKLAAVRHPRPGRGSPPGSPHIPAQVRRSVWLRDAGRCAFVARDGRRCASESFLELHHLRPYAVGGEATTANIALRCGPHNRHEADLFFGGRARGGPVVRSGTDTGTPGDPSLRSG